MPMPLTTQAVSAAGVANTNSANGRNYRDDSPSTRPEIDLHETPLNEARLLHPSKRKR
jgi:hypothetical protein